MKCILSVLLALTVIASGCAWNQQQEEKPADVLLEEGTAAFEKEDYSEALKAFEQLRDWYPFSKFAILAELKIAESYFHLEQYSDAVFAYEEFEQLHPRNEAIPYVIYQIGLCHFKQMDTVDRDQTPAQKSLEAFNRLVAEFPENPHAKIAQRLIAECLKHIAGHDFYVGIFYYKSKHYQAALERFKAVVTLYPDVGLHQQALTYIANCEAFIHQKEGDDRKQSDVAGTY
jgi:outer membrane protein assembly factor BamD